MKKRLIFVFLAIFAMCLLSGQPIHVYVVARVIDGDTIVTCDGKRIRLLGIDAPEMRPRQCFAEESKKFVEKQVLEKSVIFTYEKGKKYDIYGRTLAWVWYGKNHENLLNAEVIKQGYGFSYRKYPTSRLKEFNKLEEEARKNQRGLWSPKTCLKYYSQK
jgi:micrococcal nuclease